MKKLLIAAIIGGFFPNLAYAQSAAPELFGVREVVVEYVKFSDPKAADVCGLTREEIASDIMKALAGTTVPAIASIDAKPPSMGVARIQLIPEISSRADESLDCTSWISLSAESRSNAIISPVSTLRTITAVYWRQHTIASSTEATHSRVIDDIIQKMATQFAQQYRIDQPPDLPK